MLVLVGVNYYGDAANIFRTGYELKMAKIISGGNYVTNIGNYDERVFQKEIIEQMIQSPNTVVLGASRSLFLNSEILGEKDVFNNSVSGASLEDIIAIYEIYKSNNILPEKIILDIEPYYFNINHGQTRWKSIKSYYFKFKKHEESSAVLDDKFKELFSLSYFQSSILNVSNVLFSKSKLEATKVKNNIMMTKLTDGTLAYDKAYREASKTEIDKKVESSLSGNLYSIEKFDEIDKITLNDFKNLIHEMQKNKITVEFFFCPYHPKTYNRIKDSYPMVLKTENLIKQIAIDNNIKFYGSYSPFEMELDDTFFYDAYHCKEIGIKRITINRLNRESMF
ncbi:MAG: hypothetical protein H6584_01595 [Flavobacteriales bacterium]|nr:hypothetical protein [Flavobacteriales bacterium]